jgi:hypothetical protein
LYTTELVLHLYGDLYVGLKNLRGFFTLVAEPRKVADIIGVRLELDPALNSALPADKLAPDGIPVLNFNGVVIVKEASPPFTLISFTLLVLLALAFRVAFEFAVLLAFVATAVDSEIFCFLFVSSTVEVPEM